MLTEKTIGNFTGGTCKYDDNLFLTHEESFNMFPETIETNESYTKKILKQVEGTKTLIDFDGDCRGLYVASTSPTETVNNGNQILYAVFGSSLYRIASDYSYYLIGDVGNNNEIVSFTETSGVPPYLIIISNFQILGVNLTEEYPSIEVISKPIRAGTDEEINPTVCTQLNYRVIVNDYNTDYFYYSELGKPNGVDTEHSFQQNLTWFAFTKNDGTIVEPETQYYCPTVGSYVENTLTSGVSWLGNLNYIKAEFKSDVIVNLIACDNYLYVFGSSSYQIFKWQDNTYTPYITTSKTSMIGCKSTKTVSAYNNSVTWLGSSSVGDNSVWNLSESGLNKISTVWLEQRLTHIQYPESSFAFSYTYKGHSFYVLTFIKDDITYCYDFSEQVWHIRASRDNDYNTQHFYFPSFAVRIYSKILLGTYNDTKLVCLQDDKFTDYRGLPIQRMRTTGLLLNELNDFIIKYLDLVIDSGSTRVITPNEVGYEPKVMLQVSYDGGFTWSNERWTTSGKQGLYQWRVIWRNLGKSSRIAFKVMFTDDAPFNIAIAKLGYSPCSRRIR